MWYLNTVLLKLTEPPFEPLSDCSARRLTIKMDFLVAIALAQSFSELHALVALYTSFHRNKVVLRPHHVFIPKVVSKFHVNQ